MIEPFTLNNAKEAVEAVARKLTYGCGNGDCRIYKPKGMHTNATCECSPKNISKHLLEIASRIESMGKEWVK